MPLQFPFVVPFAPHVVVVIQPDVLHVSTHHQHICFAIPQTTEALQLHYDFGLKVYEYNFTSTGCVWFEILVEI